LYDRVTGLATRGFLIAAACVVACGHANHFLAHPRDPAADVQTWEKTFARGPLVVHVRGASPRQGGRFPAVIVHPEGGKTADDMLPVLWDLAARRYVAIAADYRRLLDGHYRRNMFVWRSEADSTAILDIARGLSDVDRSCVGLLGFSQGGVYSLLIAAHAPEQVAAVVAYYPVTDFPTWLAHEDSPPWRRFAFVAIRSWFRREAGVESDAEYARMLRAASPYYAAGDITAPVLLVHGDRDTSAPIGESERMAERLRALHKPVELLVVPGGRHIFNFRDPRQAAFAWDATVAWLDSHLRPAAHARSACFHPGSASRSARSRAKEAAGG
jgi:dienelactone hydrolase